MNFCRSLITTDIKMFQSCFKKQFVLKCSNIRQYCDDAPPPSKMGTEKSINRVTLLGRVGINPQLRGTEAKPVVIFTVATNINYKLESGEVEQKTDWHRISVFKPYLRDLVLDYLKKGSRVYVEGRLTYGEFSDSKGVVHNATSIIANDIVFIDASHRRASEYDSVEAENSAL